MKNILKRFFYNKFFSRITDKNVEKGLMYSIFDAILWAVMFGFSENYIVPFALLFGASVFQIGILQGLYQLGIGFPQLIGAKFINRFKKRKTLSIITSRIHALSWFCMVLTGLFIKEPWVIIIVFFIGIAATNIGGPGWLSWMNDLVPQKLRGVFWGFRNTIVGAVQFIAITIAGISLYFAKKSGLELTAYMVLFTLAFISRFLSFYTLGNQHEPPMSVPLPKKEFHFSIFLAKILTTNFGKFTLFSISMTFATNLVGSLIPVYIIKSLGFNYIQFTVIIMTASILNFIFMTYWGPLSDKYGNYRILFITAVGIPILALSWSLFKNFYILILVQAFSGFLWAGFNLATTNFIFDAVRRENITKIMAYFNTLNTACAFLGAVSGGFIADILTRINWSFLIFNGFTVVFIFSFFLRLIILAIFIRNFKEVRSVEKSPGINYFYVYKPASQLINYIEILRQRVSRLPRESK